MLAFQWSLVYCAHSFSMYEANVRGGLGASPLTGRSTSVNCRWASMKSPFTVRTGRKTWIAIALIAPKYRLYKLLFLLGAEAGTQKVAREKNAQVRTCFEVTRFDLFWPVLSCKGLSGASGGEGARPPHPSFTACHPGNHVRVGSRGLGQGDYAQDKEECT